MKMLISMLAACAMLVTVMGCEDKYNNSGYVSLKSISPSLKLKFIFVNI